MILQSIGVRRFRAIRDRTINFSAGLNIIKGSDNEAGKSSLRMAIVKALYQDPTTSRAKVQGLTSWGVEEPWEIMLEFQADSESYRMVKSLKDGVCQLTEIGPSRVLTSKNAIAAKVAQITGCPSETFFESTACVGQEEMIGIIPETTKGAERHRTIGAISKRLQRLLTGSEGSDVPALLAQLYAKTHRKEARGPYYHSQETVARIENLQVERVSLQAKVDNVMRNRRELVGIEEQLQQIDKALPPGEELLHKNSRRLELQQEIERDKDRYRSFQRAQAYRSDLVRKDEEMAELAGFQGKHQDIEQLKKANEQIKNSEAAKAGLEGHIQTLRGEKIAQRWLLVTGLAITTTAFLSLLVTKYGGIAAVAGLLALGYWTIRQRDFERQIRSKALRIFELEADKAHAQDVMVDILGSFGFKDCDACLANHGVYLEKIANREETALRLSGILGEREWATYERENEDLVIRISAAQRELDSLLCSKLETIEFQRLEQEVSKLQHQKGELETNKVALDRFFDYTDAATDQLAAVEEELEWREEEKDFFERKTRLLKITREMLREAHRQTLTRAADVLNKELGNYVSMMTDGRYQEVQIDEEDLTMRTFSPEKLDWVDVRELSRATQDQFYISARLALVKLITGGKKPPILLDDPFVNFHPKRLERVIALLRQLSRDKQILLFTCSDVYDDYGNVILLS